MDKTVGVVARLHNSLRDLESRAAPGPVIVTGVQGVRIMRIVAQLSGSLIPCGVSIAGDWSNNPFSKEMNGDSRPRPVSDGVGDLSSNSSIGLINSVILAAILFLLVISLVAFLIIKNGVDKNTRAPGKAERQMGLASPEWKGADPIASNRLKVEGGGSKPAVHVKNVEQNYDGRSKKNSRKKRNSGRSGLNFRSFSAHDYENAAHFMANDDGFPSVAKIEKAKNYASLAYGSWIKNSSHRRLTEVLGGKD